MYKNEWKPGEESFFEYHCWQSHDSEDAELWYRSHQPVTVVEKAFDPTEVEDKFKLEKGLSVKERLEAGRPKQYRIRFEDGYEDIAWEDELMTDPRYYDDKWKPGDRPE
jgi:hypothetical protein